MGNVLESYFTIIIDKISSSCPQKQNHNILCPDMRLLQNHLIWIPLKNGYKPDTNYTYCCIVPQIWLELIQMNLVL